MLSLYHLIFWVALIIVDELGSIASWLVYVFRVQY